MVMVANFVFKVPFLGWMVRLGGGVPANRESALAHLKAGGLLVVAPGGVREAMTPTVTDYRLLWERSGFAEVARQAGSVPIFPMFTRNIREVFLVIGGGVPFIKWLYRVTKLPFTPFLGPFLLPLTSYVGEALRYSADASKETVARAAKNALQGLMRQHRVGPYRSV